MVTGDSFFNIVSVDIAQALSHPWRDDKAAEIPVRYEQHAEQSAKLLRQAGRGHAFHHCAEIKDRITDPELTVRNPSLL